MVNTKTKARIHGCTLQSTGMANSGRSKVDLSAAEPAGCELLHCRLCLGSGCTLCIVGSLFSTAIGWPVMSAITCGSYMQFFCERITGLVDVENLYLPRPPFT